MSLGWEGMDFRSSPAYSLGRVAFTPLPRLEVFLLRLELTYFGTYFLLG
jgi:hypothetical protein